MKKLIFSALSSVVLVSASFALPVSAANAHGIIIHNADGTCSLNLGIGGQIPWPCPREVSENS